MKKRLFSIFLAIVMLLSLVGVAFAADAGDFSDVKEGQWYYEYVDDVANLGYFVGYPDGTFRPGNDITRAEVVLVLSRMAQRLGLARDYDLDAKKIDDTPFEDVSLKEWYSVAVKWATDEEITLGMGNNKFAPHSPVTREDACTLICRFIDYVGEHKGTYYIKHYDASLIYEFEDEALIRDYAAEAVDVCMAYGLVEGFTDHTFQPRTNWTRAQGAKMISVLHDVLDVPDDPYIPVPPTPGDTRIAEEKLEDGDSVTLTADYTMTGQGDHAQVGIFEGDNVVLDLGGKTLTLSSEFYGINVFGNLTIKNGTIVTYKTAQLNVAPSREQGQPNGTLTLEGVTLIKKDGAAAALTNKGTTTITECKFVNDNPWDNELIVNGTVGDGVEYAGTMTISDTTFEGTYATNYSVIVARCGTITFGSNVEINAMRPVEVAGETPYYDIIEIEAKGVVSGTVTVNGVAKTH